MEVMTHEEVNDEMKENEWISLFLSFFFPFFWLERRKKWGIKMISNKENNQYRLVVYNTFKKKKKITTKTYKFFLSIYFDKKDPKTPCAEASLSWVALSIVY